MNCNHLKYQAHAEVINAVVFDLLIIIRSCRLCGILDLILIQGIAVIITGWQGNLKIPPLECLSIFYSKG